MAQEKRAKAGIAGVAIDAKLREQDRWRSSREISNLEAFGEVSWQFGVYDLYSDKREVSENARRSSRCDGDLGRGPHRLLSLKCHLAQMVCYRRFAAIESPSIVAAIEGLQPDFGRRVTQRA